jgi:acetyl-CoA synthetase
MNSSAASSGPEAFLAARDLLLSLRSDQASAARQFQWPVLDRFNWAIDYFDAMASGNEAPALWIVNEDGSQQKLSFREMAERSNQVANFLRAQGVKRGDRILLVLGNEVALWESMLGAFKLGAVVIPATSLLTPDDLRDRLERGRVRHVIAGSAHTGKFAELPGDYTRICVGAAQAGWLDFADSDKEPLAFEADSPTLASDPLLLYFTSGTTSKPKLVLHTHQSYPVGHLSTMYWIGLKPGDVHLNISSPGWAKHAWSCFFAPWNAGACVYIHNVSRFNAAGLMAALERDGITTLCAPPTVWRMLIQEDMKAYRGRIRLREVIGAGEPLNPEIIEQVRDAWA